MLKPTVNLTDDEATALALRIVVNWCEHGDWPMWEDYPFLGEHAFERLCGAIVARGETLHDLLRTVEERLNVDSADILSRVVD